MASWSLASSHGVVGELYEGAWEMWARLMERQAGAGKGWDKLCQPHVTVERFRSILLGRVPNITALILDDTHLAFVSVGAPWWDDRPWLIEQLYCRIGPGRGDPLAALEDYARHHACAAIGFGTSLANDRALGRLLQARGYSPESSQLIKEL